MDRIKRARDYFYRGYNCAQAVFLAYCDLFGVEEKQGEWLSSGLGGGMGGLREKCGAVTGMFLLAGLQRNGFDRDNIASKRELYALVRQLNADFERAFGTTCCKELLQNAKAHVQQDPTKRDDAYYQSRPCALFVEEAARIVEHRLLTR